jgi:hypothetical protein
LNIVAQTMLVAPLAAVQLLEALDGLRRRSLVERGQRPASFTLQSVVLEYATTHLVEEVALEIEQGLELATAKEYVRQTQTRPLVAPLLRHLLSRSQGREEVERRLLAPLSHVRERADDAQGYAPANLPALLREERGHLRGLDLSRLSIRQAYLQGVELQDTSLVGARLHDPVFTETFDAISAVAISRCGRYWAAGSKGGEVRVWEREGRTLHRIWQAHTDIVIALTFSPDGRSVASVSHDGSIKLWEVQSGQYVPARARHPAGAEALTWAPGGELLISGGNDGRLCWWNLQSEACLRVQLAHQGMIRSLKVSPDGRRLASS